MGSLSDLSVRVEQVQTIPVFEIIFIYMNVSFDTLPIQSLIDFSEIFARIILHDGVGLQLVVSFTEDKVY